MIEIASVSHGRAIMMLRIANCQDILIGNLLVADPLEFDDQVTDGNKDGGLDAWAADPEDQFAI